MFIFIIFEAFGSPETTVSLMLDPAGDAQHTGRKVDDSFERGVTLQCAEGLKKAIEEKYPWVRAVLTRFPGETVQPLQNAIFANRLAVDIYLSIHCYQETSAMPMVYMYYLSFGEDYIIKPSPCAFYHYDQAHMLHQSKTKQWARAMADVLENSTYRRMVQCKGPFGLPCAPLIGITAPAIALDCGIKNKNDWQSLIEPLMASLEPLLRAIKEAKS